MDLEYACWQWEAGLLAQELRLTFGARPRTGLGSSVLDMGSAKKDRPVLFRSAPPPHTTMEKDRPIQSPTPPPRSADFSHSFARSSAAASFLTPSSRRDSWASYTTDSPYSVGGSYSSCRLNSLLSAEKYALSPDPREWGFVSSPAIAEPDDALHNPELELEPPDHKHSALFSRALTNLGCLVILGVGFIALFIGYPVISYYTSIRHRFWGYNLGGINSTGQIPSMGNFGLIDSETPHNAYTRTSWRNPNDEWQLVFSDEFNTDGRSFYPGDDPYWEAADLHYWATNNMEWYDPAAVTTAGGSLVITLSQMETHDLHYQGGMVSTWNKFCFTGGLIETSVSLPGANNVMGLWPAVWTMGNLGRAGYGASLEGMWPYTYDACDVGTLANQTLNGLPPAAHVNGDTGFDGELSFLPGQRLSRCTCGNEDHPGPKHSDGTWVGRSAPEIDVFEAQMGGKPVLSGEVSQSAQWAPFNAGYVWLNTTDNEIIPNPSITRQNSFIGSVTQQAASVITKTDQRCYEYADGCFSIYAFEYKPGFDDAYITWVSDNKISWTLNVAGLGPDEQTQISARPVPQEPMYIIANLGMSKNFGEVDVAHLQFPAHMRVDYIRVYQPKDRINIGCNPKDFPTAAYISKHAEAYTNPNLTTWKDDYKQPWPKNKLIDQC
ncbi:hypothetical protein HGRIS_009330 [Hohenbuehelia grisea]|uniref:GH16 domain-containing protein n=1 Tax=Hohenbuehelia grisea TaxID=104357 RepID=A0ABR3J0T0_9AGAR